MAIVREKTDLDKKPTWYLFLFANIIVFLGSIITLVIFRKGPNNDFTNILPTLICNLVALALCGLFIWLEAKGIMNKAMHFRKKWLYWYLIALIIFAISIIFCFFFVFFFKQSYHSSSDKNWQPLIWDAVVTGVLTLVAIGLQRYARYKIDLDIYRRTHGELPKKEEIEKAEKKAKDSEQKASSGLADSIN